MSNKASTHQSLQGFIIHSCLISYGLINAIINAIIFFLINRKHGEFTASILYVDLAVTTFILSVIVAFFAFMAVKGAAKKGNPFVAAFGRQDHLLIKGFPKNNILAALLIGMINTILVPALFVGIAAGLNLLPMGLLAATLLKGAACGTAGALTGYLAIMSAALEMEQEAVEAA